MSKTLDFVLFLFCLQLAFSQVLFLEGAVEVEIDEFKEAPLDLGTDVSEEEVVEILVILIENVPSASYDLFPLRLAGLVLQPFHNLLEQADVDDFELIVLF